ncbi:mechanosensitive ion channel [Candidatus Babeliales bacterium]|nr:mechanosensitive ion channel [Candidatus Babeliales bacterium]
MKIKAIVVSLMLFTQVYQCDAGNLAKGILESAGFLKGKSDGDQQIYLTFGSLEGKQRSLEDLKKEYEKTKDSVSILQNDLDEKIKALDKQLDAVDQSLKKAVDVDPIFLQKQQSILREHKKVLVDIKTTHKEVLAQLEEQIKLLEDYLKDPAFESLSVGVKSVYSFEHLQNIYDQLVDTEETIRKLDDSSHGLDLQLESLRHKKDEYQAALTDKQRLREELVQQSGEKSDGLNIKQQGELIDAGLALLKDQRELVDKRMQEVQRKKVLIAIKRSVEQEKRKFFDDERAMVRRVLRVEDTDVRDVRTEYEETRHKYEVAKEDYMRERESLVAEQERVKEIVRTQAADLGVSLSGATGIRNLVIDPKTIEESLTLYKLLGNQERVVLLGKKIELIDAHVQFEDIKRQRAETLIGVVDAWNKITMRLFRSDEEVDQDLKAFQKLDARFKREQAQVSEKRDGVTNALNTRNKDLEILSQLEVSLNTASLFKKSKSDYNKAKALIDEAQGFIREHTEVSGKLLEVYSSILGTCDIIQRQISIIVNELKSLRMRPAHAISWEGVKNILPDLTVFKSNFVRYTGVFAQSLTITNFAKRMRAFGYFHLFILLMRLMLIGLIYVGLRWGIPRLRSYASLVSRGTGLWFIGSRIGIMLLDFFDRNFIGIFVWGIIYFLLRADTIQDTFIKVLFYLGSIPYLMFLTSKLLQYFTQFDREQEYQFLSETVHQKVRQLASIVFYSSIGIFFFREAFMLLTYNKSELPTILLAVYSIIIRLVLISLVSKEDILELIPTTHKVWLWLRRQVEDNYYAIYGILVALIILSEPHIGYGSYISYVLWGIIATAILMRFLLWLHFYVRDVSSRLFFIREGEILRERFAYSKSAYGLFIILTFIGFGLLLLMLGARAWGYAFTFQDLYQWLQTSVFVVHEGTTMRRDITILSFMEVLVFIFSSFIVSYLFNRFVLKRTFTLLMVEPGVQYTLSTISHYFIVLLVMLLGFQRVGLGSIVAYAFATLFFGLAWSMKDYANDFVSYFIILVQRPFKIGDFVNLNPTTQGIIRKITPRSVILRSKNSVTVLVPNSQVVKGEIRNWNYSRGFSAFDDILIAVPYDIDPDHVKILIFRVLDLNVDILKNPRPIVRLDSFGADGFVFMIRGFHSTDNVLNRYDIASDVRFGITRAFRAEGIPLMPVFNLIKKIY